MNAARSLRPPGRGLAAAATRPPPSSLPCFRGAARPSHLHPQPAQAQRRTWSSRSSTRAVESLNVNRLREHSYNYHLRRRNILLAGFVSGLSLSVYTAYLLVRELRDPKKFDAADLPPGKLDPFKDEAGTKRKTVVHDAEGRELVPTGDSTVPTFPRLLTVATDPATEHSSDAEEVINEGGVEYTLVGLGARTVSIFGIRVYVVGFYVATQDVAAVQARLVREISPIASTLIPSEKDELRAALLDPARGERIWRDVLADARPRSLFRIVPVRDTNFHHLRDGFVRAIQARSSAAYQPPPPTQDKDGKAATTTPVDDFNDEAFGRAMRDFKNSFKGGNAPKAREMLLCRDAAGALTVTFEKAPNGQRAVLGRIPDERVSRLLWLNYLAGAKVASEPARKNIVEGIMEFVERPIGTVAAQVL